MPHVGAVVGAAVYFFAVEFWHPHPEREAEERERKLKTTVVE
jgi:hypothetical protein